MHMLYGDLRGASYFSMFINNAFESATIPINEDIDIGTCFGVCHGTNSHDFRYDDLRINVKL